jgi:two-component system, NarL family, nitrate/nitrite response regulator NarL
MEAGTMQDPNQNLIRVLIIDDHPILRAGLRLLIESQSKVKVVGEAQNRVEAVAIAVREQPDIMLVDLSLGDESGLDLIPELLATVKQGRVVILTGSQDLGDKARAVQLGARGLVLKEDAVSTLINAIERVHQGGSWFEPAVSATLLGTIAHAGENGGRIDPERNKIATLTKRELEIISLVSEGLKNQQIADRLFIGEGTVRNYLTTIYDKLGVSDRFELIVYAYRHGITKHPN